MVHPTSVTNVVDRLESHGLVERRAHPTDRRVTLVAITRSGRGLLKGATDAVNGSGFGLAALPDGALEEVVAAVRRLRGVPAPDPS